jgi:hypothetical protein
VKSRVIKNPNKLWQFSFAEAVILVTGAFETEGQLRYEHC